MTIPTIEIDLLHGINLREGKIIKCNIVRPFDHILLSRDVMDIHFNFDVNFVSGETLNMKSDKINLNGIEHHINKTHEIKTFNTVAQIKDINGMFFIDIKDTDISFFLEALDETDIWGANGKETFLESVISKNKADLERLSKQGLFDLSDVGMPVAPAKIFSRSKLAEEGKTLMAHILVELGIFKSVGQAKKNGHDKPIVLGEHSFTKKNIKAIINE